MADDVLQADADLLSQVDRRRKTVAYEDCTEVQVGERSCFAEREEEKIRTDLLLD